MYNLITNFQQVTDLSTGMTKSKLKMVDFRQGKIDIAQYQKRFRFVDWEIADAYFQGFDENAINMFFSNP